MNNQIQNQTQNIQPVCRTNPPADGPERSELTALLDLYESSEKNKFGGLQDAAAFLIKMEWERIKAITN